jgi:general secretion pathway protein D
MFSPPGRLIAAGATFQVPVVLTGGKDIASVPLQIQYDPVKLSLVNVANGDLLSRDNQAVALVHLDDGAGSITCIQQSLEDALHQNGLSRLAAKVEHSAMGRLHAL